MFEHERVNKIKKETVPGSQRVPHVIFRHVLACLDTSPVAEAVLAHAVAIASATGARLTVMRVLEPSTDGFPSDPVDWTLRHRTAEADLRETTARCCDRQADAVVTDGPAAERICTWVRDNGVDLTVLGTSGANNWPLAGLGNTARRVAQTITSSVLLVPAGATGEDPVRYRRVMTPLDGSSRSESALPIALGISDAHNAEFVIIHAAPNIDLTEIGPLEAETIALRNQLRDRNERVAEKYLGDVKSRLPRAQNRTHVRVLASGDPRHALARAVEEDDADIVILSCTGLSGHPDLSVGSVADYLINHSGKPTLLVRAHGPDMPMLHPNNADAQATRLPSRATT